MAEASLRLSSGDFGPGGRHYGLLVDLRLSAVRQVDFFAKLFWIKKRVFGYFFQKVTLLNKDFLICS